MDVSFKAVGIYHILKKAEKSGMTVNMEQFADITESSISGVRSGFKELIEAGCVEKFQVREGNRLVSWGVRTKQEPKTI